MGVAPPPAPEAKALAPLSLRVNFLWTLLGTTVYAGAQWGMVVVLAKLGSPEMVGRFAIAQAIAAPVVMFSNLQLRIVQATDARDQYRLGDYVSVRLVASLMALLIVAGAAIAGRFSDQARLVILIVGAAKCVESVSDVIHGFWQKHERLDLTAVSMLIKGPASLAAMAIVMKVTHNVMWAVVAMFAVWTTVLLTYDTANLFRLIRLRAPEERSDLLRGLRAVGRWQAMRALTFMTLPLGVVGLLDSLNVNVPRYFITHSLGERALGHFAAMAYLIVFGNMVVNALTQSAAPRLARHYVEDVRPFRRLVWQLVRFGLVLAGGGVLLALLFGRQFLTFFYRADYGAHSPVLVWLMVAAGIGYVARFLTASMTAARRLRAQAPLFALTLITVAGLSALLIPRYGLHGAAWGMCGSAAVLLCGTIVINVQAIHQRQQEGEVGAEVPASAA